MNFKKSLAISSLVFVSHLNTQAQVVGESTSFASPNGLNETCVRIQKVPGGTYSRRDLEKETEYCSLNFYNDSVALCPKTWSTSPGTIVHGLDYQGRRITSREGENLCRGKATPLKSIVKFKQTMNQSGTSGTFSLSSLLYYHMSRYLDTTLIVPPSVYRTMDKDAHYARVSSRARPQGTMNAAGWDWIQRSEQNPNVYRPTSDLFTDGNRQIYGALLKDQGERYGIEINGDMDGKSAQGRTDEIQNTPAFRALFSDAPLRSAIESGINESFRSSVYRNAFSGQKPSDVQMVLWMKEMSEMVVLDHMFNQQDRVGNIDFIWHWVYIEDGKVKTRKEDSELPRRNQSRIAVPEDIKGLNPELVQKTSIGDNDAGVRAAYVNRTKRAELVAKVRHLDPDLYKRVIQLSKDFEQQGSLYQYFKNSFSLSERDFQSFSSNVGEVAQILMNNCQSRLIKFDLASYKNVKLGQYPSVDLNCSNP